MRNCRICSKELPKKAHHSQKDCGHYKTKMTCSWVVARLTGKFVTIKERCTNPNHKSFINYSKVKICDQWISDVFSFVKWAADHGWKPGLEIDRIDNQKGYSPDNCRFVTRSENCRNKRKHSTFWDAKMRRCRVCKLIKSFDQFMISRKEIGGIAYECRLCRKEIDRLKYLKNKLK